MIMDAKRLSVLTDTLNQVLKTLVHSYQPDKIILFGSMVEPRVETWSDLDLVLIKSTSKPFLQRLKEVALLCQAPVGIDFLVYTPEEFEEMVAQQNPFILEEIIHKGAILYERAGPSSSHIRPSYIAP